MRMRRTLITCLLTLLGNACANIPEPRIPIAVDRGQAQPRSDTLVVFLPGRGSRENAFREKGFFDDLRAQNVDVVSTDAHLGYYIEESITRRLHEDIIEPARAAGYQHIWLAGLSMGGMGAALYADHYPGEIDGMILLAPYPGDESLTREIRSAGGLMAWDGESDAGENFMREAWRRIQFDIRNKRYPILIGFGESDRFAEANRLIAEALPEERVFTVSGGHTWTSWIPIWQAIMDAGWPSSARSPMAAGN